MSVGRSLINATKQTNVINQTYVTNHTTKYKQTNNNSIVLEQRLKTIDNLYKKGILSEEEYQRKRKEILKGI